METINKLLSKPAPKRRTRAEMIAAAAAEGLDLEEGQEEKPDALYVRWTNSTQGSRIGVPQEWMDGPIGAMFAKSPAGGRMVEEVA